MQPEKIVLLSGHVCSGKSTLADMLERDYAAYVLKTREELERLQPDAKNDRKNLQEVGEQFDKKTSGAWVREALLKAIRESQVESSIFVVDSVRTQSQIDAIRKGFGRKVVHIHLTSPFEELKRRYSNRTSPFKEFRNYETVQKNITESRVFSLMESADTVIDTFRCTENDVLIRAACRIGMYHCPVDRLVDVLVGGQLGSEGKGNIASYLAPEYDILMRVGGPNAGHRVYLEPEPFTFHHLPSGTLSTNSDLVIGPGAVLNPTNIVKEIADCGIEFSRLSIDPCAMVINAKDIETEERLAKSIGSTKSGVGAATARKILERGNGIVLAKDIPELSPYIRPTLDLLDRAFRQGKKVFLEGTQGTGLSLHHGDYPFVTSRDTTVSGCLAEAGISPARIRKIIMVCRTYPIRVESPQGADSGPLSQEISWNEIAKRSKLNLKKIQKTERTSTTNRERRVSEFDWQGLRKATSLNAPTDIALTFADYINAENESARRYEQLTTDTIRFIEEVELVAGVPVSLISTRFHPLGIIDRRNW